MNIHAIIHEQIDWDGTIKSFQFKERDEIGDLWIAFPGDYDGQRNSPFYFLDREYETNFHSKVANSRHVRIAKENFYQQDNETIFQTKWHKITTKWGETTYYALYLPEYAVPSEIKVTDPYKSAKEFTRSVFRDDEKNRFVIYIECSSRYGVFSFDLWIRFQRDQLNFGTALYQDAKTVEFYKHLNADWVLAEQDRGAVNNFFIQNGDLNQNMRDTYNVNQAGAVGPGSSSNNNTFNQQQNTLPENTNYNDLKEQLITLKKHLSSIANGSEQYAAIAKVAGAEEAAEKQDGNKVILMLSTAGKWVFDAAKDIGVDLAAEVIKKSMGI